MAITTTAIPGKKNGIAMTRPGNNEWFPATVEKIVEETPMVKSFFISMPHPVSHLAGQHYELRLTAENGYQAARLYSAASPAHDDSSLQLTIMDVEGGEVSPYVTQTLAVGDQVEIRGPFGKFFVWTPENTHPVLLIGGGGGVVPMHAILQAHKQSKSKAPMKLFYSVRHFEDIIYKDSFLNDPNVTITLTKQAPDGWDGETGRINKEKLSQFVDTLKDPLCYICGMSAFVDAVSDDLIELGIPSTYIKTERFGQS